MEHISCTICGLQYESSHEYNHRLSNRHLEQKKNFAKYL